MRDNKVIAIIISLLLSAVFFSLFILYHRTLINQSLFYTQEILKYWSWGFISHNIQTFFILIILLLTFAGIGYRLLKLFKISPDNLLLEFILSTGLGLGFFSLTTLSLGFLHLFSPLVFYPLLLCSFLCSYAEIKYFLLSLFMAIKGARPTPFTILCWGCLSIIFSLSIILSIGGPPILFDSLVYHLAIPDIYIRNHGIVHIPHLLFANYPLNTEMLFTMSMILSGDTLAQLIHPLFGILAGLSIYALTRDYVGDRQGLFATLIFFSMPSVIFTMTFTFNDLSLTYYIILAVYTMIHWVKAQDLEAASSTNRMPVGQVKAQSIRWLALSGIFIGLAMGTKYSGIISFGILLVLLVSIMIATRKLSLKELSIFSLSALLPVLPWLLKNLIFVENPVYPFLYEIFGGVNWDAFDVQRFSQEMSHYGPAPAGVWKYLSLPLFITCDWSAGDIPIGPIILFFLPLLFFIKNIDKTIKYLLIFCLLYFLFWINTSMVIRFLFPGIVLLCPVIGYIIKKIQIPSLALKLPIFIALILNIWTLYAAIGEHADFYLKDNTREEKLLSAMPVKAYYQAIRFINESLPQGSKVLFIGEPRRYYCEKEVLTSSELNTEIISRLVKESKDTDQLLQRLKKLKITHILYNKNGLAWLNRQFNCLHWENEAQKSLFESFIISLPAVYARDNIYLFQITNHKQ